MLSVIINNDLENIYLKYFFIGLYGINYGIEMYDDVVEYV